MEITVKSIKILSKGTNAYGPWMLVKLTTVEDVEYTTLAENAELIPPGSVINITNMDEDAKGKKFKKYEVIEKGQVSSSPEAKPDGDMTNEMWAEKQRIERRSIERQVSAKIAFEHTEFEVDKTLEIAEEIYQWISGQPMSPKPSPERTESTRKASKSQITRAGTDRDLGAIKSLPEFHKAISDDFGIQPLLSLKILDKETWPEVTDSFEVCYLTIMRSRADND